jgi:hypothetical protein
MNRDHVVEYHICPTSGVIIVIYGEVKFVAISDLSSLANLSKCHSF